MKRRHFINQRQSEALRKFDRAYEATLRKCGNGELDSLQLSDLLYFEMESQRELCKAKAVVQAEKEWEQLDEPDNEFEIELDTFELIEWEG